MVTYKRFQIQSFDVETFGILENWSLKREGRFREVVATEGSTVFTNCKEGANLILIHCNKLTPKTKDIIIMTSITPLLSAGN